MNSLCDWNFLNRQYDALMFSFSWWWYLSYIGHGGQVKDRTGDEKDGMDETLVPVDYQTAGQIIVSRVAVFRITFYYK